MAEEQKILSIIDYINQNNICNKYLNKLKNIIGSSNVEILSRVKLQIQSKMYIKLKIK